MPCEGAFRALITSAPLIRSYEETDFWSLVRDRPEGLDLNFVKASRRLGSGAGRPKAAG